MVNVFFRPPLPSSWTITIECFLGGPTIGTNGFLMVFKILRAMVNKGLFYPLWSIFSPLWSIFNLIWTLFEKTPFLALVNEFCLGQNDLLYVLKRPLQIFNGFWGDHHHWMFLGGLTIAINGFTMVFWCCYHRFWWFLMVSDHWSNDAMVSMDRCGLSIIIAIIIERRTWLRRLFLPWGESAPHSLWRKGGKL